MNDVIKHVLEIQNKDTEVLAEAMVQNAQLFQDTLDFQYLINILGNIERTLLANGVFLQELLDVLDETNRRV